MVAQSVQCDIDNRVDNMGTGVRVPAAARDFSTTLTNVTVKSKELTCICYC